MASAAGNEEMPWFCPTCKPECGACNTKMVKEGVDYNYNPLYVNTPGAPAWCMHCKANVTVLDKPS